MPTYRAKICIIIFCTICLYLLYIDIPYIGQTDETSGGIVRNQIIGRRDIKQFEEQVTEYAETTQFEEEVIDNVETNELEEQSNEYKDTKQFEEKAIKNGAISKIEKELIKNEKMNQEEGRKSSNKFYDRNSKIRNKFKTSLEKIRSTCSKYATGYKSTNAALPPSKNFSVGRI